MSKEQTIKSNKPAREFVKLDLNRNLVVVNECVGTSELTLRDRQDTGTEKPLARSTHSRDTVPP